VVGRIERGRTGFRPGPPAPRATGVPYVLLTRISKMGGKMGKSVQVDPVESTSAYFRQLAVDADAPYERVEYLKAAEAIERLEKQVAELKEALAGSCGCC
jgi:hypothetical protein